MHNSPAFLKLNCIVSESCKSQTYSILTSSSCKSSWNRQDAKENSTLEPASATSYPAQMLNWNSQIEKWCWELFWDIQV